MRVLSPMLLLMTCAAPLAAADAPVCVPRHDGQDLLCVGYVMDDNLCVSESLNPPAPFTYQNSSTCAPLQCPPSVCGPKPPVSIRDVLP